MNLLIFFLFRPAKGTESTKYVNLFMLRGGGGPQNAYFVDIPE